MNNLNEMQTIDFSDFLKVGLAVGRIVHAELNLAAKKPAYKLSIDFGDLGIKVSSAQLTDNYTVDDLQGRQIVAVMNFPVKRVAGVKSEVLVLAAVCEERGTVLLEPTLRVKDGTRIL